MMTTKTILRTWLTSSPLQKSKPELTPNNNELILPKNMVKEDIISFD